MQISAISVVRMTSGERELIRLACAVRTDLVFFLQVKAKFHSRLVSEELPIVVVINAFKDGV